MRINTIEAFSQTHGMLQSTISIEAYKELSMANHTRSQRSHLGNETNTSVHSDTN